MLWTIRDVSVLAPRYESERLVWKACRRSVCEKGVSDDLIARLHRATSLRLPLGVPGSRN